MSPSHFTRLKITVGYSLLLVILLFSLIFVHREIEVLSAVDDQQNFKTDSLLLLLREKDRSTIQMLRVLSEANDSLLSAREIEEIIAEQKDSVIAPRQHIQNRVIIKKDSLITKPQKKSFLKRLAEVFVPSKKDTAILVNTSREIASDTILESYNQADSLHQKLREASQQKQQKRKSVIRRNSARYQQLNSELTAQMDTLIKEYERNMIERSQKEVALQQRVRSRSVRILGGITLGAVLLSVFFLVVIWRDIARSNRYRRELEEANCRAKGLLEAREKMMLTITHDFKAPLSSIIGYTDLLTRLTKDEREKYYLGNMKSSSSHLLKLVNDLLDFHKLDLNKVEINRIPFNPAQLFEEIRVSFEPLAAAKGLALECKVAPELLGRYVGDPLRLRQIINNLMSNAIKFTQQGSVRLLVDYASSVITIEVADTGKGMGVDDRKSIFQEFTRLPGAQGEEGFGLGLSIVHKLVTLLEGEIDVYSTLGQGSRFRVTLPLCPVGESFVGESTSISSDESPIVLPDTTSAKKIHLLLIDDDKIQLGLTAAMLAQQGVEAECCEQLEDLMERLRDTDYDMLLTDIQMPAMNGFDLLKLLRASNIPQAKTIPIIAVTARSDMNEESLRKYGFAGCLHKPFSQRELMEIIEKFSLLVPSVDGPRLLRDEEKQIDSDCQLNFSALTAFSEDDPEAAYSILQAFVEETGKNLGRMEKALAEENPEGIVEMAHKLLPLFTLINASDVTSLLEWLETQRGKTFSTEINNMTVRTIPEIRNVIVEAEKFISTQQFPK